MNEIKCPKCGEVFKVDESGFADIVKQVRDDEFARELDERIHLLERDKESAVQLARASTREELAEQLAQRDSAIAQLEARLETQAREQELALNAALANARAENEALAAQVAQQKDAASLAQALAKEEARDELAAKDAQIIQLSTQLEQKDTLFASQEKLAVAQAVKAVEQERDELRLKIEATTAEGLQAQAALKEQFEETLRSKDEAIRDRDDQIALLRDMRTRMSTKMVGETLELHCETEFNRIRAAAFPRAYFDKDNDVVEGSKGDYIFRDYTEDGTDLGV